MAQRPTITDVAGWLNIAVPDVDTPDNVAMALSLAAATESLENLVSTALLTQEGFDLDDDTSNYSTDLFLAVIKFAVMQYKSRTAPEGTGDFGGQNFRITATDGPWFDLIERFVEDGFS